MFLARSGLKGRSGPHPGADTARRVLKKIAMGQPVMLYQGCRFRVSG